MSKLEAIFFDHDGTLVDTEPIWAEAKTSLAADYGKTWTEEDTLFCLGKPATVTFQRMQELGIEVSTEQLYSELKQKMSGLIEQASISLLPGIPPLLEEVAAAGIPAGIVTNATRALASRTAALGPDGLFKTLVTDEDVAHAKPDPEPYLLAARNLGVDPRNCVAIEDSGSGAQSASAAGVKVIVVPGLVAVAPDLGHARYAHTELTLGVIRALVES